MENIFVTLSPPPPSVYFLSAKLVTFRVEGGLLSTCSLVLTTNEDLNALSTAGDRLDDNDPIFLPFSLSLSSSSLTR